MTQERIFSGFFRFLSRLLGFGLLAIIGAIAAFVVWDFVTGPSLELRSETQRREEELNTRLEKEFPLNNTSTVGKSMKVSDMYPYDWDYVCATGEMMESRNALRDEDRGAYDKKISHGHFYTDDEYGLVFFEAKTKKMMAHVIDRRSVSGTKNGSCVDRNYARLISSKPSYDGWGYVELTGQQ